MGVRLHMTDAGVELGAMIARFLRSACPDEEVGELFIAHDYTELRVSGRLGTFIVSVSEEEGEDAI